MFPLDPNAPKRRPRGADDYAPGSGAVLQRMNNSAVFAAIHATRTFTTLQRAAVSDGIAAAERFANAPR